MKMKQNGSWLDRPVTWRTSLKINGVVMAINMLIVGVYYTVTFWDNICDKLENLTNLVKKKLNRD